MNIKNRELVYDGFMKLYEVTAELDDGRTVTREVMERGNAVAALVFDTKRRKYIFVKQFRPGPACVFTEIVAGTMDKDGESSEDCVRREIEEETGYKTDSLFHITSCYFSPGSSTEKVHIFYAEVSEKSGEGGGEEEEGIEIVELDEDELKKTDFEDSKTYISIQWLFGHTMKI